MNKLLLAFMLALVNTNAVGGWFGPNNYDECVNKYTKDAVSNYAVNVIAVACQYKFKEKINIDYANCLLDEVPNVKTDRAAAVLAASCKSRYLIDGSQFIIAPPVQ